MLKVNEQVMWIFVFQEPGCVEKWRIFCRILTLDFLTSVWRFKDCPFIIDFKAVL